MKRILYIPPKELLKIKKLLDKDTEYGGWIEFLENKTIKKITIFKGDKTGVSIPTDNYEIHWHTHPSQLISDGTFDQTGPLQPPSVQDIANSSYSYFDSAFGMGHVLVRLVFTRYGIYVQEPIGDVLDAIMGSEFMFDNDEDKEKWMERWYNPFKKEADKIRKNIANIGLDLGGYINEDTGEFIKPNKAEKLKYYEQSIELENKYFELAKRWGVYIGKIPNWNFLKNGLEIELPDCEKLASYELTRQRRKIG